MRWLPTLIFSPSSCSSSSSSSSHPHSTTASSSSSATSPSTIKSPPSSTSDTTERRRSTGGTWFFGAGKKSTRSRKLRHVDDDNVEYDVVATTAPISRSPSARSYIRSSNSVAPQPLPLPELALPLPELALASASMSASASSAVRPRDADCRLPSPKEASSRAEPDVNVVIGSTLSSGFKMRSVFASRDPRRNTEHMETRPPGNKVARQDTSGAETPSFRGNSFRISVPPRSASNSPFTSPTISPHNTKHDDFVPYYYVSPKANHFWSAPEMPTSSGQPPPAFFDLSASGIDCATSPHQSSGGKSPRQQNPRSPTRSSSPLPRLSLDYPTTTRRESLPLLSVHPLPLPPWPGTSIPSPSGTYSQPGGAKTESVSMKSQWQKGKLIGRGTFGSVYVATNRETGALCAMKEAEIFSDDPKSAESIKQLEQEIKVLSQLKHPNIVQYYGSEIIEDKFYIYLEFIHPGSINKYVRDHCGAVTESVVRNFTRHILSGLAYLHSKKTIHRDIKGANLLVDSSGVVKLADFGMAKHLTGHSADLSLKGSPYWMAPELMQAVIHKDNSPDLAFAIDIWSLGCTIIEMFTGKPPWSEYEGAAAMFKVMKDTPAIPETLSQEGKDFLRLCFKRNPAERPTASMLLEHRFLKNLQYSDPSPSSHLYNGTTLMDKPHSPRGLLENKPDQFSIVSAQITKGKSSIDSGIPMSYSLYS
ncbi:mitogen-activated protein kinase kinase kinase 5-like [Trifolium pratense]|uniref:mitogen-activated protein kinase kinase kinase 5-like n=1 Tax=Trifolium pratense TaxID=57577 RepID=UPI001E694675|nr:mitogen-activated protein kinase kinase kinase 5-like [Trifolium pratense]